MPVTAWTLIGPRKSNMVSKRGRIKAVRNPFSLNPMANQRGTFSLNSLEDMIQGNSGERSIMKPTLRNRFLITSG